MDFTLTEFRKLIRLYKKNSLREENLIYNNCAVPISAVIQAVSITEDSYEPDEMDYLIKDIFETIVNPNPSPIEFKMMSIKKGTISQ